MHFDITKRSLNITFIILNILLFSFNNLYSQNQSENTYSSNRKGFISIINTHSTSTPWAEKMIDKLLSSSMVTSHEVSLLSEHMHIQVINSLSEVSLFKKSVISRQNSSPEELKLVLFIGLDAFIFFEEELKTIWKDIPVVVATLEEHIEPIEYYISKRCAPRELWIPLEDQKIHNNTLFIKHKQYFSENIEIMMNMIPNLETFTLLTSHQHSSAVCRELMNEAITNIKPEIKLRNFIENEITSDDVISILHDYSPYKDGVIYFSWQQHRNPDGNIRITSQAYKFISRLTKQPIFNLIDVGIENGGMIGGLITKSDEINTNMIIAIEEMLDGKKASDLSKYSTVEPQFVFNYFSFIENGISPEGIPSKSIIYNEPESYFEKNIFYILGTIISLVLLLFAIYTFMLLKQKSVKDEKIKLLNKHKYLFNNMPIPYLEIKVIRNEKDEIIDFVFKEANPAFTELFPNYEEFIYKTGKEIYPNTIDKELQIIRTALSTEDSITNNETYVSNKKIITSLIKKSSDNNLGIFFVDNTNLYKALEEAKAANQLKSAFLANMSHEIRTPLNAIVGFSELILTSSTEEEKIEYGQIIEANSNILLNLINDILDLSKIEAGYVDLYKEDFDLAKLYLDLYSTFSFRMKDDVKLLTCIPFQQYIINWDKKRITQIITNFMTNAIKFTDSGYIEMGFYQKDNGLSIYVKDTGIGVNETDKHKIFERFEKVNEFAQGTGLGMSICKAIVDSCNGEIGFDSTPGKGSCFWAFIPCSVRYSNSNNKVEFQINKLNDYTFNKKLNILIAEDNESNYKLISAILKHNNITRACNGIEAVELFNKNSFDLVFMDMRMPKMDGIEATKKIRNINSIVPIIAVTANAFDTDRILAIEAGCNEFITKPLNHTKLKNIISLFDSNANIK